ncbi:PhzF family phenazine biosynthesis protein [Caenimonas terrae]|uniref:PhzF family phenazine biosynthesis protein n=1 Tax=Caenimonas terrae TaxID=696074 RepID=A0ABW0NDN7_9BURK
MRERPFKQVDVFTETPYRGNPLAVVLDGSGLDDAAMQRFARWTNLSETTFLLPPTQAEADYRVRIFTPGGELPFAGHPTLGSCHAWLEAGGAPRSAGVVVQECKVGLVRIRRAAPRLAFAAPPLKLGAASPGLLAKVADALGLGQQHIVAAQMLDNGPVWLGLLLDSPQTVLRLQPDHGTLKALGQKVGVSARYPNPDAGAPSLEVRAFAAPIGIEEDPVTGSLNASLAHWLIAQGHMPAAYVAAQGGCIERSGRVHIEQDASQQIWVGGESVTCIDGQVRL